MSAERDKIESQLSDVGSKAATLRQMLESAGWAEYMRILNEQRLSRHGEVLLKPLSSMDAVLAQEFMKGEVSGLVLAQVTPHTVLENLQSQVTLLMAQLEKENELEKMEAGAGSRSRVDVGSEWHSGD